MEGKGEGKRGSFSEAGIHPDRPAVFLDQSFGNRQAETGTSMFSPLDLIELIEDLLKFVGRDADARVLDFQDQVVLLWAGADENRSPFGGELEGV